MRPVSTVAQIIAVVAVLSLTNRACVAMETDDAVCPYPTPDEEDVEYDRIEQFYMLKMNFQTPRDFPLLKLDPDEMIYFYTLGYQTERLKRPEEDSFRWRREVETPLLVNPQLRVRMEIRQLTDEQWTDVYRILNWLKDTKIGGTDTMTEYDIFVYHYNRENAPQYRRTAATWPWHREFLKRFEEAMDGYAHRDGLPYWDSSLDEALPNPADSIIWSPLFFGNSTGEVTSGPFAGWTTTRGCQELFGVNLKREVKPGNARYLFSRKKIYKNLLSQKNYSRIIPPHSPNFEYDCDAVSYYVGGHMKQSTCAPNDPVFWFHYSFVDLLWEEFRTTSQETNPTRDYPPDESGPDKPFDWLYPFQPMLIMQAMSDYYSWYYQYTPRPSSITCLEDSDCGSKYLWCHTHGGCRCVSKVQEGGNCEGLQDSACYCSDENSGRCLDGVCFCTVASKKGLVRIRMKK